MQPDQSLYGFIVANMSQRGAMSGVGRIPTRMQA